MNPGSGRYAGEGNGYTLQYSCLKNPMDREAWGGVQSMGSQRVGHDGATNTFTYWTYKSNTYVIHFSGMSRTRRCILKHTNQACNQQLRNIKNLGLLFLSSCFLSLNISELPGNAYNALISYLLLSRGRRRILLSRTQVP